MIDIEFIDFQRALAGEYSLERELGRGGMGIVFLAREVQLNRLVALKLLPPLLAARPGVRERFLREARTAASLSHPHIVSIYRVGEAGGFVYFAMAYVEGGTLGDRLRARGPMPAPAVQRLLREVTWALSYAHGRGIIHRDVKPDNILLEAETGRALVSDFGIALGPEETAITGPGRIMGSAHFMSPEQAANEALDGRSDLYALGVVAYLALSGRLPFDAPNVPALLVQQATGEVTPLAPIASGAPRELVLLIERCLRRAAGERYPSGETLLAALEATTAPAAAKLPVPLRIWTQARDPLVPFYVYASGVSTLSLLRALVDARVGTPALHLGFGRAPSHVLALWPLLLIVGDVVPFTLSAIFHARKAYKAFSAGYGVQDLRAALAIWRQERQEELAFELDQREPWWAKATRRVTTVAVGSGLAAAVFVNPTNIRQLAATALLGLVAVGGLAASNVLGVRLVSRRMRLALVGAARSRVWNSRLGEWAAKVLTPRTRQIADLAYRPTEMALGVAVGDLYDRLPVAQREQLADLPSVVGQLEAHAAASRARLDELAALEMVPGARAATPPEGFTAARERAKRELATSVAALESLRLDLLRLHGGMADLQPVTTMLEAARELGRDLDRLAEAQQEAGELGRRRRLDITPATPA